MPAADLVVHAPRAVVGGNLRAVTVTVVDGAIERVAPLDLTVRAARVAQLGPDEVLLPGLVDTHVHVNEPGRTDWEGFASATAGALDAGVTTLIDTPLNCRPPILTPAALDTKRRVAAVPTRSCRGRVCWTERSTPSSVTTPRVRRH